MFKGMVSLPETEYLGFGVMMPWTDNLKIQFGLWEDGFVSGKLARLKDLCGSDSVVGVFCFRCDMEEKTFSYHIACENKTGATSDEFEVLKMEALTFARFENKCDDINHRFEDYNALCDEIWGQWLLNSDYISLIEPETFGSVEGYAALEIYNPEVSLHMPYTLELLLPVRSK